MAGQEIAKRQGTSAVEREEMRAQMRSLTPSVDIFETDENLTFIADMPGVARDGLDINLEKGYLTLNGKVNQEHKGRLIFHEFSSANYYRQFKLPELIDPERAEAELVNGVLTLTIAKSEAAKPRRIEIKH